LLLLGGVVFYGSDLNIWGINMDHYLFYFSKWLDKQFSYKDEELHKKYILEIVSSKYITNDDDARDWINHDLLKLYQLAYKDLQKKIWNIK
jgi:hypothetical protein